MIRSLLFSFLSISTFFSFAQNWQEMLIKGETDFNKIQESFYQEWDGVTTERGSGYKQFKRWEHRMLPRLIDNKYLPNIAGAFFERINENEGMNARTHEVEEWTSLGPRSWTNGPNGYNPGIGRVNCVDFHPTDPNTLYVGTPAGGLWKSIDSGVNWNPVFEDLPVLGVTDLYINPVDPNKMYLLTGDAYGGDTNSIGMLKTSDGGANWENSGLVFDVTSFVRNFRMIVDPSDSDVILIAGNAGLLRSADGGDNWETVLSGILTDVEFKPGDPTTVYASSYGGGFYRSTNSGLSWTTIQEANNSLGRTALGVSADDPTYVYMLASTSSSRFGGIYKSTNSGVNITLQSNSPNIFGYSLTASDNSGQGNYDLSIAVNPDDAEDIYVSGVHIWNSKDGGLSWQDELGGFRVLNYWVYDAGNTSNYVHADNHTLDFISGNLFAGSDGGIWRSANLGGSWTDLSATLNNTQFYRLGQDPNDENRIVAGAQDNGSNLYTGTGWIHLFGADGMEALIDHTEGSTVYSTYQFGGIIKYSNNVAVANITSNLMDTENVSGGWITPYMLDPNDNDIIYLGLEDIWKSENQGSTWTKISSFGSSSTQLHLTVSASNTDYIYTTTGFSTYRTKNGGASWETINAGLPSIYMTYLAVSEDDPETIWATFSGYTNGEKVYKSTNAGDTWTNVSNGLPNIPANCIVHLKGTEDQVYVGTDIGVYEKSGEGDWNPWFEGLPNVEVSELEIHYGAGKVRASTFGRGIWERPLGNRLELNMIAGDQTEIVQGESVSYSSTYDGEPESILWTFEGGTPTTSSEESPEVTYNTPGIFDVKLQIFGVNSPSIILEEYVTVIERLEITSLFASNENPQFGQSVVFDVKNNGEVEEWTWTFEGGTPEESTDENPRIVYNQTGTFDVTVEIIGANTTSETFHDFITVLAPLLVDNPNNASIRPTVAAGSVNIDLQLGDKSIEVYDAAGRLRHAVRPNGSQNIELDFTKFEAGVYILRIYGSNNIRIGRVIKR